MLLSIISSVLLLLSPSDPSMQKSCCSSTTEFASLSKGADFRAAHQMPAPEPGATENGERGTIPVPEGKAANVYRFEAEDDPKATILVIHEWWGMNQHVVNTAEKLWLDLDKQVRVIAVDLYDGVVATTREAAAKAMQENDELRSRAILNAVIASVNDSPIATIGWCFGGGWSLQAAIMAGEKARACIVYYGMPEKDVEVLRTLQCPVLGIYAKKDQWITVELVEQFQKDMETAERPLSVKMYDADHAFANPSNAVFDREATNSAWNESIEFFRATLLE